MHKHPKDHGYSWIILLATCFQMMLTIGVIKTSGFLFVTFQERFGSSSVMTSLLSTVQNICFSITSIFVTKIGIRITTCRNLVFVGSTMLCVAFVVTSQAENISVLLFSHGVLHGIAVAFNENAFIVMLGSYFDKRRGFSNSIASCGGCIGGLIFAPLLAKMLTVYGYKGSILILAGILFNGCISGALFRPLSFYEVAKKETMLDDDNSDEFAKGADTDVVQTQELDFVDTTNVDAVDISDDEDILVDDKSGLSNDKYVSAEHIAYSMVDLSGKHYNPRKTQTKSHKTLDTNTTTFKGKLKHCLGYIVDYDLMKRPVFICFTLAACMTCPGTALAQVFVPPHARDIGASVDSIASLVMIYSVVDISARLVLSVVSDRGWVRRSTLAAIATALIALNSHCLRFYTSYNLLIVCVVIQGLLVGVYFSLFPVILVDYMTLDNLHSCLGVISLCHGLSIAWSFYLIGYLRDETESYWIPFHVLGTMAALGSIFLFLLPLAEKMETSRQIK